LKRKITIESMLREAGISLEKRQYRKAARMYKKIVDMCPEYAERIPIIFKYFEPTKNFVNFSTYTLELSPICLLNHLFSLYFSIAYAKPKSCAWQNPDYIN
jgi:hypothetical protein